MKTVGIIAEFNPFHNGHAHLITEVKKAFPNHGILCVMSGNFVQRGSMAVQEKYSRAKCAVCCGADLVLELPFPFSSLAADGFAQSAVSILKRTGVCNVLAFGSEMADGEALKRCAERLLSEEFREARAAFSEKEKKMGYPAAREAVYRSLYGEEKILSLANASLAVEYLLAMKKIGASFLPFPVLRVGPEEWENTEKEGILSATALREKLYRGESIASWVPSAVSEELAEEIRAGRAPVSLERYFGTLIYLLRCEDRSTASEYYGLSSVFDRLRDFSYGSKSLADLIVRAGNQNVTDSRLRRSLQALLCRIPRYAEKEIPAYTRVLAVGEKGREILFQMKELQGIPVVTKPAHLFKISDRNAMKWAALEMKAEEIYSMAFEKETEKGYFLRKTPYLLPSLSKKDDPA
ncbi:MAG: nucleotidyltransferase family protein [Clostridia bacterium]|nr:nucleotidyltransferase family protein [Clostridia bacterium]